MGRRFAGSQRSSSGWNTGEGFRPARYLMAVEPDSTRLDGSTPHTILDLQTWEEFEEKLKELQKKAPPALRPEPLPFLYRGQENSYWTITTTLERPPDGRVSMPFGDYYLSIYRAKPEIESYAEKSWDVPDPSEVKGLTERVEPFVSFTKEVFETWGQVWSYMVHLRHHGFPHPSSIGPAHHTSQPSSPSGDLSRT